MHPIGQVTKVFLIVKFYVSVNFHTGFSFNRFSPIKELAVRLVRDR